MSLYMHTGSLTRVPTIHTTLWVGLVCSYQQSINCGKIIPNNGGAKKMFGFAIKCCLAYGVFGNTFTFLGLAQADVVSCTSAAWQPQVPG